MKKKKNGRPKGSFYWTDERLKSVVKKFKYRATFRKNEPSAYATCLKRKPELLKDLKRKDRGPKSKWNLERLERDYKKLGTYAAVARKHGVSAQRMRELINRRQNY